MIVKVLIVSSCFLLFCLISSSQINTPSDKKATRETRMLYESMQRLVWAGIFVGHHDDLAYGVGWRGDKGRSDVKTVTGSYPALYGWDLAGLELDNDKDINSIPFKEQRKYAKEVYERGGINTFCWHLHNPVNNKTAWDTSGNTVKQIINGGAFQQEYIKYLDKIAKYLKTLKGSDGENIPVLFRPFHELTGNWFWWGRNTCSPDEFKALWRFSIDYLRNKKNIHHLIVVFSVADFNSNAAFLERYPGDDYVDVISFDSYCYDSVAKFDNDLVKQLDILKSIGLEHRKLMAICETGYQGVPKKDWWTEDLLRRMAKYPISYIMLWRNGGTDHYYVPYEGQQSAPDFVKMYNNPQTMFQDRLSTFHVYGLK